MGCFRSAVQYLTAVLTLGQSCMIFFSMCGLKTNGPESLAVAISVVSEHLPRFKPTQASTCLRRRDSTLLCFCNDKMYVSEYLILHDSVSLFPLISDQTPLLLRNVSFVRDNRKYSVIETDGSSAPSFSALSADTEAPVSCHINVGYLSN